MPLVITIDDAECVEVCCLPDPTWWCVCCCSFGMGSWDPPPPDTSEEVILDPRCLLPTYLQWDIQIANSITVISTTYNIGGPFVQTDCYVEAACDIGAFINGTWTLRRKDRTYTEVDPYTELDPCADYHYLLTVPCTIAGCQYEVIFFDLDQAIEDGMTNEEIAEAMLASDAPKCSMETILDPDDNSCLDYFAREGYLVAVKATGTLQCKPPSGDSGVPPGLTIGLGLELKAVFKDCYHYTPAKFVYLSTLGYGEQYRAMDIDIPMDASLIYCNDMSSHDWVRSAVSPYTANFCTSGLSTIGPFEGQTLANFSELSDLDDNFTRGAGMIVQGDTWEEVDANITSSISFAA